MPQANKQTDMFSAEAQKIRAIENEFEGSNYARSIDHLRLSGQLRRIFILMADGHWRTLSEIEHITGDPQSSISAQLRHLRKEKWGAHKVEKKNNSPGGTWKYRVVVNIAVSMIF